MTEYLYKTCKITADEFNQRHWELGESLRSIARSIGVTAPTLDWHVVRNGLRARSKREAYALRMERDGFGRKWKVNKHFFDTWTPEMAWVLGLVATDGTVASNRRQFSFASKDDSLIQKYRHALGHNGRQQVNKTTGVIMLPINSVLMVRRLIELGITPAKSATLRYPPVPSEFQSHFLRGVFDGDGCLHVGEKDNYIPQLRMSIVTISKEFAYALSDTLKALSIKNSVYTHRAKDGKRKPRYNVCAGSYNAILFCQFIYQDTPDSLCLTRKRTIFEEFIKEHGHKYVNGVAQRLPPKHTPHEMCTEPGCNRLAKRIHGLCEMHLGRQRRAKEKAKRSHTSAPT